MAMAGTKVWTHEELHKLPDDGNTYELLYVLRMAGVETRTTDRATCSPPGTSASLEISLADVFGPEE